MTRGGGVWREGGGKEAGRGHVHAHHHKCGPHEGGHVGVQLGLASVNDPLLEDGEDVQEGEEADGRQGQPLHKEPLGLVPEVGHGALGHKGGLWCVRRVWQKVERTVSRERW